MYSYPFHIRDYLTKTRHLSPIEDLAYRRLLDTIYTEEKPLPADPGACARVICLREHEAAVAAVLQEFFVLTGDGWVNDRAMHEIGKYHAKAESARNAIRIRWEQHSNTKRTTGDIPTRKPKNPKTENLSGFDEFWSSYPKKVAKSEAEKSWSKLSPDGELLARILAGLTLAKTSRDWTKDDGQFVPHASTWLNQRRWEDEVKSAGEPWDDLKGAV